MKKIGKIVAGAVLTSSLVFGSVFGSVFAEGFKGTHKHSVYTKPISVNVLNYGAIPNDGKDDTNAIQAAVDAASVKGQIVDVPPGDYSINAVNSIWANNNTTINFERGARFVALPNSNGFSNVIRIWNVSNVKITGHPVIIGERDIHTGSTGEWGMGISIESATNVDIENASISKCWGDGIYIGEDTYDKGVPYSKDITINNAVLDNNRRQGISVISAKHLNIINPKITNTNGAAPAAGIDFEPNNTSQFLQNINVVNPNISGNAGNGIQFYWGNLGTTNPISININNVSKVINNATQPDIQIYGHQNASKGYVIIGGSYLWKNL